jgi:membrane-bound metal-dependent hydrolase YbcI (DUF457 family)
MSWAAHDLEPYSIQKHLGLKVAIIPLLLGSYAPDLTTKWFVYGVNYGLFTLKADDPEQFHRGWPGAGFTHSLAFGVVVALVILLASRGRPWGKVYALSFLIGQWAHTFSDLGDTRGCMLLFPFTTERFSLDAWQYAGQTGRYTDAGAYFSGLGWVWDGVWVIYGLMNWRVLTRAYFHSVIVPADGVWVWAGRYVPEALLLTLYRASFFYGTTRWIAWLIWAHVRFAYPFDLEWGGPDWVQPLLMACPCCVAGCYCCGMAPLDTS